MPDFTQNETATLIEALQDYVDRRHSLIKEARDELRYRMIEQSKAALALIRRLETENGP